jgi:hypothetical protein
MLRSVALVRTYVSEEIRVSIIRVTRTGNQERQSLTNNYNTSSQPTSVASYPTVLPTSPILVTLMMESIPSSETSVLTIIIRRNIPEGSILLSHLRENLKFFMELCNLQRNRSETVCYWTIGASCGRSSAAVCPTLDLA